MRIAVLGGGNGSFAAAGDFALQGHQVRLWRRDAALVQARRAVTSSVRPATRTTTTSLPTGRKGERCRGSGTASPARQRR